MPQHHWSSYSMQQTTIWNLGSVMLCNKERRTTLWTWFARFCSPVVTSGFRRFELGSSFALPPGPSNSTAPSFNGAQSTTVARSFVKVIFFMSSPGLTVWLTDSPTPASDYGPCWSDQLAAEARRRFAAESGGRRIHSVVGCWSCCPCCGPIRHVAQEEVALMRWRQSICVSGNQVSEDLLCRASQQVWEKLWWSRGVQAISIWRCLMSGIFLVCRFSAWSAMAAANWHICICMVCCWFANAAAWQSFLSAHCAKSDAGCERPTFAWSACDILLVNHLFLCKKTTLLVQALDLSGSVRSFKCIDSFGSIHNPTRQFWFLMNLVFSVAHPCLLESYSLQETTTVGVTEQYLRSLAPIWGSFWGYFWGS